MKSEATLLEIPVVYNEGKSTKLRMLDPDKVYKLEFYYEKKIKGIFNILPRFKNLKELSFFECNIGAIPPKIHELIHLKKLELIDSYATIPIELQKLGSEEISIQELTRHRPDFKSLVEAIKQMGTLKSLYLSHKKEELPLKVFEMGQLEELSLHLDSMEEIPKEISRLAKLKELNLKSETLSCLPEEICTLDNLESLTILHSKKLKKLPQKVHLLSKLQNVEIDTTGIENLPQSIVRLSKLKKLIIRDSLLKKLPKEIGDLAKLEELDLCHNKLEEIPESTAQLFQLKKLLVRGNKQGFRS